MGRAVLIAIATFVLVVITGAILSALGLNPSSEQGLVLSRRAFRRLRRRVDYSEYGGAPLLGVAGTAIVAHGRSSAKAIRNAIAMAYRFATSNFIHRVEQEISSAGTFTN